MSHGCSQAHSTSWSRLNLLSSHCRSVKKSPGGRYGKPVRMASSNSVVESDPGNGSEGEGEGPFPASYQAPLAALMSKGKLSFVGLLHSFHCVPLAASECPQNIAGLPSAFQSVHGWPHVHRQALMCRLIACSLVCAFDYVSMPSEYSSLNKCLSECTWLASCPKRKLLFVGSFERVLSCLWICLAV